MKSLFEYLSEMKQGASPDEEIKRKQDFLNKMITIFSENLRDDRVTIPLLKTIELLFTSDYLNSP